METLDRKTVKATPIKPSPSTPSGNHDKGFVSSARHSFLAQRFGHILGHTHRVFARSVQITEGNRDKATVSLTVVFPIRTRGQTNVLYGLHLERPTDARSITT